MAVPEGDQVIPVMNDYIDRFIKRQLPVFATRDWHPTNHCSFIQQGGPWPEHCIAGSKGAEFSADLHLPATVPILFPQELRLNRTAIQVLKTRHSSKQLDNAGVHVCSSADLATDYCVLNTVRDALNYHYEVLLLTDAIRAVNVQQQDGENAINEMIQKGAIPITLSYDQIMSNSALLTDLYQLTMLQGYYEQNMEELAVFEFFVRKLPKNRGYLVAAGLAQVLTYLEQLRFSSDEIEWLAGTGQFKPAVLDRLETLKFTGDVHAMPEGTVFFPNEPILRITAPLPEAQLIESRIINLLHFQTLIASKAARSVLIAAGQVTG